MQLSKITESMKAFKINGYHTGDIHYDESNAERLTIELNEVFIKSIDFTKPFIITITGDLVHKKMDFDSVCAIEVVKFVSKLRRLVIQANMSGVTGYLRIVTGTLTHDNKSLKILEAMWADEDDQHVVNGVNSVNSIIKFIDVVQSEELEYPEINALLDVLYVPEEYPKDPEEYYYNFFRDTYDFIFGHGTCSFTAHSSQKYESERSLASAPIFDEKELNRLVKLFIIFGHIHTAQKYGKLEYHGSFSRECHGEEKAKGFLHTETFLDKNGKIIGSEIEFIENKLAPKFKKIPLSFLLDKVKRKPEWSDIQFINYICAVVNLQFKTFTKIRLVIDRQIDSASQVLIRSFFANNKNFQYFEDVKLKSTNNVEQIINTIVGEDLCDAVDDEGNVVSPTEEEQAVFIENKEAISSILEDPDNIENNISIWLTAVENTEITPEDIALVNSIILGK